MRTIISHHVPFILVVAILLPAAGLILLIIFSTSLESLSFDSIFKQDKIHTAFMNSLPVPLTQFFQDHNFLNCDTADMSTAGSQQQQRQRRRRLLQRHSSTSINSLATNVLDGHRGASSLAQQYQQRRRRRLVMFSKETSAKSGNNVTINIHPPFLLRHKKEGEEMNQNQTIKAPPPQEQVQQQQPQQQQEQGLRKSKLYEGDEQHTIAGLNCDDHGGPFSNGNDEGGTNKIVNDMIYWNEYEGDSSYTSPYKNYGPSTKYLTFEPDEAGWNNQRICVETMVVLAISMGRTLVLPPKSRFDYNDLYPFISIAKETAALNIISTEEFLIKEGLTGNLHDQQNPSLKVYPPENNRTNWDGDMRYIWDGMPLWLYLRQVAYRITWDREECVVAIAKEPGHRGVQSLEEINRKLLSDSMNENVRIESYTGYPTAVNATPYERLREVLAMRKNLCIYHNDMQNSNVIHFVGDGQSSNGRVLAQYYLYVFLEDYKVDLWTKRFVRDHLRYSDEIQCASARIIQRLRSHAKASNPITNPDGIFDTFHIRRSDFLQFQPSINVTAEEIVRNSWNILTKAKAATVTENSDGNGKIGTLYIASDEYDREWFDPFRQFYDIYFLNDFEDLFPTLGGPFWGMLEQLVTSQGRYFLGTYYSTFTAYINRLRGYHYHNSNGNNNSNSIDSKYAGVADDDLSSEDVLIRTRNKEYEREQGIIPSYYFAPKPYKFAMRQYRSISTPMWAREFPIAWRDIDRDFV